MIVKVESRCKDEVIVKEGKSLKAVGNGISKSIDFERNLDWLVGGIENGDDDLFRRDELPLGVVHHFFCIGLTCLELCMNKMIRVEHTVSVNDHVTDKCTSLP